MCSYEKCRPDFCECCEVVEPYQSIKYKSDRREQHLKICDIAQSIQEYLIYPI